MIPGIVVARTYFVSLSLDDRKFLFSVPDFISRYSESDNDDYLHLLMSLERESERCRCISLSQLGHVAITEMRSVTPIEKDGSCTMMMMGGACQKERDTKLYP